MENYSDIYAQVSTRWAVHHHHHLQHKINLFKNTKAPNGRDVATHSAECIVRFGKQINQKPPDTTRKTVLPPTTAFGVLSTKWTRDPRRAHWAVIIQTIMCLLRVISGEEHWKLSTWPDQFVTFPKITCLFLVELDQVPEAIEFDFDPFLFFVQEWSYKISQLISSHTLLSKSVGMCRWYADTDTVVAMKLSHFPACSLPIIAHLEIHSSNRDVAKSQMQSIHSTRALRADQHTFTYSYEFINLN